MKKMYALTLIITVLCVFLHGCDTPDDSFVFEFDLKENIYYSVFVIDTDNTVKEFFRTGSYNRALSDNEKNELYKLLSESEMREVTLNDSIIGDGLYFELNGKNTLLLGVETQLYCNINNTTYQVVKDSDVRNYMINKYYGDIRCSYSCKYDYLIDYDSNRMLCNRYFFKIDNKEDLVYIDTEKSYSKVIEEDETLKIAKEEINKNPNHKFNEFTVYRDIKNEYYGVLAAQENVLDYEVFIIMDKYGNIIYMQ